MAREKSGSPRDGLERHSRIKDIDATEWDRLTPADVPFADHAFLSALEESGAVGGRSGWKPTYVTLRRDSRLIGAVFLFEKTHSYGEYIFDWSWANAFHAHGLPYYPKLTSAFPFTPATGPKLLLEPTLSPAETDQASATLIEAAESLAHEIGASSLHWLFIPATEIERFERAGYLIRHSFQYHWRSAGERGFDDFLGRLRGKRRREIARERSRVREAGIRIRALSGNELAGWPAAKMHEFYLSTVEKRGGFPYLPRLFFERVFETMRDRMILFTAFEPGFDPSVEVLDSSEAERHCIAAALFFSKGKTLFGRQWGATRDAHSLHFELCYYQGIDAAIARGLTLFEAGAQGEHKISRGFRPTLTYSAHRIFRPDFHRAISVALAEERHAIARLFEEFKAQSPFSGER